MTSPANKRPLCEAIRDTDVEPAMLTKLEAESVNSGTDLKILEH